MNNRDREVVATMVAEWEWFDGGSASEAAARYQCGQDVIRTLEIPEEEMAFARTYEVFRRMGDTEDNDLYDALDDMVENEGY